ncbi:MAG TPA: hypothetical protein VKU87_07615, partial [Thermomicrobiaceae bacterium]|nr:hypothetical protein [Thermomicrobiaceae bacterium]
GGKALDLGKQIVDWIAGQLSGADWSGVGGAIHDGLSGALSTIGDLGNSFGPLRDAIGWVQSNVVPILDKLAGIIESRVSPVIDTWRQSLQQCWDIIKQSGIADELVPALEGLGIVLGTVATIVGALVSGALLVFANTLGKVLPDAVQFVVGVIQILVGNFALIRDTVVGVVTIISDLIHGDWSKAWDDFKGLVSNTIRDVQTIVQGAVNIIEAPFKAIVDFVKGVFQGLYDVLVGHSLIPDLVNAIQNLITGLKNWLEGAWTSIKQTAQQVWTDAKNLVTGIVTSLKDGITGTVSSLKDWLENAWNAIKLTANAVWMVAKVEIIKIVSDLWQGIQDTVSQLRDWLASAWDTIKQKASDTWNGIKSTVSNLASDLKNALTSTLSEARDALAGVWDSVKQKASDTWNGVKSLVSNAKNDIRDAMLWPFQQARDAIGGIVSAFESNLARPWNVAADGINGFIRGLASAVNWVAGQLHIGGIGTPGNLIPHFARGGITPGGMFVAGEEGPELVVAPKGSRVYTKQQTDALFSAITGERGHPEGALLYPGSDGSGRGAGGITGAIEGAASSVAGAVGSVVSKATHVVSTVAGEAVDLAGDALNAVRGVISKGFDWLAGQAFSGLSIGTDGLGALSDIGSAVFSKLIDGAKSLARKWFDGVKAAIDSADADAAAKAAAQAAASGAPAGSAAGGNPAYDGASVYSHAQTVAGIYMYCEKFVGDVLNSMAGHHYFRAASAADHANMQPLNPGWGPLGAVQFWDWDTYGHVAFSAGNGGGYWGTVNSASGTGYTYAPGWTPRGWTENPAANGGIVQEPVIGVGLKSGQSYSFGEAGPERIVPTGGKALGKDSGGSDGITINYNAPVTISSQQDLDRFSSDSAYSVKQAMRRRGVR